ARNRTRTAGGVLGLEESHGRTRRNPPLGNGRVRAGRLYSYDERRIPDAGRNDRDCVAGPKYRGDQMSTQERIIAVIKRVSGQDAAPDPEESLFDSGHLDSFALTDMVGEIEKEF